MSVQGVVADAYAHSCIFVAVLVERQAAHQTFFPERAVMIIHEQQAGRGIAGDKDIRPAVFVKIRAISRQSVCAFAAEIPDCLLTSVKVPSPLLR